jgi:cytochrome c6
MKRIVAALAALAFAGTAVAADAAAVYSSKCNACHGKDGKGTAVGKKMGAPDIAALNKSEADIAAAIANGKGKMTGYKGKLTDEEIQAVAKFVKNGLK